MTALHSVGKSLMGLYIGMLLTSPKSLHHTNLIDNKFTSCSALLTVKINCKTNTKVLIILPVFPSSRKEGKAVHAYNVEGTLVDKTIINNKYFLCQLAVRNQLH